MDDGSWVQRKDALGAQRAMIANGLDFFHIGRIGGRQIDADDVVLRAQRPNDLVVDRRDDDVPRVLRVGRRVMEARATTGTGLTS